MKQAESKCCMWIQEEVYKEDYEQLKAGKTLPNSRRLLKLDPYYDEEDKVIRVGGRLQFADLPEENKHQIILPHGHPGVARLIQDVHRQMLHAGPVTVLSVLRQNIWLTQDVCLARYSESDLAHRRLDHYPRKECQPPYHLYTLVLTVLEPYM